jgi:MarR family multiple antibiotic resistance transcriptional regulator
MDGFDVTARAAEIEELSRLLNAVAARLDNTIAGEFDGMTVTNWHVLAATEGGIGVPMSALAAAALLPGPSLTRLIDGMVDANLVHRKVDETDRRRVLVFQTRRGAMVYEHMQARVARSSAVAEVLVNLEGTPCRLMELHQRLQSANAI